MKTSEADVELMRIFNFTAADLEANRVGHITEQQSSRLHKLINNEILFNSIFIGALLIIAWFIVIKIMSVVPPNYDKLIMIIMVMGVIPTLLSVSYLAYKKIQIITDIKNEHVDVAQGIAKSWTVKNYSYVAVSDKKLDLGLNLNRQLEVYLWTLPKETQFRVYYVSKSKKVVVMEIINS